MIRTLDISIAKPGLIEITNIIIKELRSVDMDEGLCTLFIQHTSASLLIQENDQPSAVHDLERWLNRLVPEGDPLYTHLDEGPDDMPAHIKSALTCSSLSIPVVAGRMALGRWQGIYLWEHRSQRSSRRLLMHLSVVAADRETRSVRNRNVSAQATGVSV